MTGQPVTILGGGPAGLAAGYFAQKRGIPFTIYEASERLGGHAVTYRYGPFLYDSGAHRFHDKDPEITNEIQQLLGLNLHRVDARSQIYSAGRFVDFPLSPLNLLADLGVLTTSRATLEVVQARLKRKPKVVTFKEYALVKYGPTIASRFLLNYSEKLWGLPSNQLSPLIAGRRLQGLNMRAMITEAFWGRRAHTAHLEGTFYYPRLGIGMITDALAASCGGEHIRTQARITRLFHDQKRIVAIEVNGRERVPMAQVVSTLPLSLLIQILVPPAEQKLLALAAQLRYRNVLLVAMFVNRASVSRNASVYFPDGGVPFTRLYEPKNRSEAMAPADQTCLAAELPCQSDDALWAMSDAQVLALVQEHLIRLGLVTSSELIGGVIHRLTRAYPILERGVEQTTSALAHYLRRFENLRIMGRNGRFVYTHLHDLLREGKELMEMECP